MEKAIGSWTLFLDRDGVINRRIVGDYVKSWKEFEFLEGVLEAFPLFKQKFNRLVVVTNQQGIAKGRMSAEDLEIVHQNMVSSVQNNDGKIDKVYYCAEHERFNPHCRKPNPGMAEQAQQDFPEINFEKSVMVGDSVSDIEFGKNLGMKTVFLTTKNDIPPEKLEKIQSSIDYSFGSLIEFAQQIDQILA